MSGTNFIISRNFQHAHFIRCIKANDSQLCDFFDASCVERQLLTTGTGVLMENEPNLWHCKRFYEIVCSIKLGINSFDLIFLVGENNTVASWRKSK